MASISLCMIVKNEEKNLKTCLDSIHSLVDEIIIVDTGSTDKTKEIANEYTNLIYDFRWVDDFSKARNFAFSKGSCEYQMWLDADEILSPKSIKDFFALSRLDANIDVVTMKQVNFFHGEPSIFYARGRLFKRNKNYRWQDPVHEYITMTGKVFNSDIEIHHRGDESKDKSNRNLIIYENLLKNHVKFSPRQLYYYARELKDHLQYEKAAKYFTLFLDTKKGWSEDNIATCYSLAIIFRELKQEEKILPILLSSFIYDTPRAEICSEIGYFYKRRKDKEKSLRWFLLATTLEKPDTMGFLLADYWGYIPNLECCVIYWELGNLEKAIEFNERAAIFKPNSPSVIQNRTFFENQLSNASKDC